MNKNYELMLVIKPELEEGEAKKVSKEILDLIKKDKKSVKEDFWGKRKLAYKIKKYEEAYYSVLNFEISPEDAISLKDRLNLNDNVIRYLLTVVD